MNARSTNTSDVDASLPPAVVARRVDDGRRRELARALHAPKRCTPAISERLDHMRRLLARYRAEAISLHARLMALELAGNDNVAPLRRALIASSVQIESISQLIAEHAPRAAPEPAPPRFARGTEQLDEWLDLPTLRRVR